MRAVVGSASRTARRGKIVVQTYRGYGTTEHIVLIGRVLREASPERPPAIGFWRSLRAIWRMMRAWGLAEVKLTARFNKIETTIKTDKDGYFHLRLDLTEPPSGDRLWHQVAIRLEEPTVIETVGDVFIPRPGSDFVVISDIDDTVMHTGVANKLFMMWRLFVQGAESRTAIPGMVALLRALHRGPKGDSANPMLYVSRAPWAIYGVLERFFQLHGIPEGPILFLREWGLTLQHPVPRRGKGHKHNHIRQAIEHFHDLPFILIGDSGQQDPEVYADIVKTYPNRIRAIYIRDVGNSKTRGPAISQIAAELAELGSPLVLAVDVRKMAASAAERGLIKASALDDIGHELDKPPTDLV